MNAGTSSLRCPYCGQEFLSLQQRTDSPETCPHCAYSSPLASFITSTSLPLSGASAPGIPLLKRIVHHQAPPAPPPAPSPPSVPSPFQAVVPPPPAFASPFGQVTPPKSFPSALESLFQSRPSPFVAPPTFAAPPSPPAFQLPEIPDLGQSKEIAPKTPTPARPAPLFPPAPEKPSAKVAPAPAPSAPPKASAPPPWPGLQPTSLGTSDPTPLLPVRNPNAAREPQEAPTQRGDGRPFPTPLREAPFREIPQATIEAPASARDREASAPLRLFSALLFTVVLGFVSWVAVHHQDHFWTLRYPAASPSNAPETHTAGTSERSVETAIPTEEIRRATLSDHDTAASAPTDPASQLRLAAAAVPDLVSRLFEATSPDERASCVADPDRYADQVESFFAADNGSRRPGFTSLQQFSAVPLSLPEGQPLVLFQVTTDANPSGALLRPVRQTDGTHRIHWPLFQETHERHLEKYLASQEGEPRWFHIGLRPSHGFDLPPALREKYLIYDLQASAETGPRIIGYAAKDTALARFLKSHIDWGEIYLARVLVRWTHIAPGIEGLTLLDCEGSSAAIPPAAPSVLSTTGP